jgi:acyl carrier protein
LSSLSREEIRENLASVFEEVLGEPVALRDDLTAADVDGWDSVVHVMLILATERKLGIRFESAEIASAGTVGEFISLIESKQPA